MPLYAGHDSGEPEVVEFNSQYCLSVELAVFGDTSKLAAIQTKRELQKPYDRWKYSV
jgi:hypothetical protein